MVNPLIHYFIEQLWIAALFFRLQLKSPRSPKLNKEDGSLFAHAEVVNLFLATYATDDMIADTVSDLHSFTQDPSILATVYSDAL